MSATGSLREQLEKAVEEGKIPQGVVFAASRDGAWFFSLYVVVGSQWQT